MRGIKPKIFIIGLTLLAFSLSISGQSATLYRCVNSQGSVMVTDNPPTDPDYKCTFGSSYKDLTPQERAEEERGRERQQIQAEQKANVQRRESELRQGQQREGQKPSSKFSGSGAGKSKVTIKRIGSNLYEDIFTHIVIKTSACVELALMDDALLDAPGGIGELLFFNTGMSCMVVKVYR